MAARSGEGEDVMGTRERFGKHAAEASRFAQSEALESKAESRYSMRMGTGRFLRVERVAKRYGGAYVIDGVDLALELGTAHGLVGPNGSGKTTLLRLLARLEEPSRGRVFLDDADDLDEHRALVGYLGHDLGLYDELTAREQLAFASELRDSPLAVPVRELLALEAFLDRPLGACSRGQRQRVALAQALVGSAPLLLLDEPTTGLDAATATGLAELVRARVRDGALLVVSTHEPAFLTAIGAAAIDVSSLRGSKRRAAAP